MKRSTILHQQDVVRSSLAPEVEVLRPYLNQRGGKSSVHFCLQGLKCGQCLAKVEGLLRKESAVDSYWTSLDGKRMKVTVSDPLIFPVLLQKIKHLGFEAIPVKPNSEAKIEERDFKRKLKKLAVAGVCAGNIMLFSVAIYLGADADFKAFFTKLSLFLSLPILFYSATSIFKGMWTGLYLRSFNLDVPIGLALLFGYLFSFYSYILSLETIYFDSLAVVVFLILSSRFILERFLKRITGRSRSSWIPGTFQATILDPLGNKRLVSVEDIKESDKVLVARGEVVPVDGEVESSQAIIDNSVITGEAEPVVLETGSSIFAGSRNCADEIRVRPHRLGVETRVGRLIENSQELYEKNKNENLRWVAFFTSFVFFLSFLIFSYFFIIGEIGEGFYRSFSMIIIACPCAVSFGLPLIRFSVGQWALKNGILLRSSLALSRLEKIKNIVLDKTGTITSSAVLIKEDSLRFFKEEDLRKIMALEAQVDHPISKGIMRWNSFSSLPPVESFQYLPAQGIEGLVDGDFFEILGKSKEGFDSGDVKYLFVYKNSVLLGKIEIQSEIRSSAESIFNYFAEKGMRVSILSGDSKKQVKKIWEVIPESIREKFLAEANPEEKARFIESLDEDSLMVGDGINDLLAIKKASVGLSMPGALEDDLKASHIALLNNDLGLIEKLFYFSKTMNRTERYLITFTFLYNIICIVLAALGYVQPVVAAILMPISSIIVLGIVFLNMGRLAWR